ATDDAIRFALAKDAKYIVLVPCCQAEVAAVLRQVAILPYARLYGVDDHTVYLQHTASEEAMLCEDIDSLVLCQPPQPDDSLRQQLDGLDLEVHAIGDCQTPRTAEEAIYEATRLAWTL
ncbi:methyltransferase, partial [Aquitalea pelogenes]|uniref:methyltransferase n=1 Tax=Aquitalea pelogenes TaxID=1293573 RepID=UPI000AD3D27F